MSRSHVFLLALAAFLLLSSVNGAISARKLNAMPAGPGSASSGPSGPSVPSSSDAPASPQTTATETPVDVAASNNGPSNGPFGNNGGNGNGNNGGNNGGNNNNNNNDNPTGSFGDDSGVFGGSNLGGIGSNGLIEVSATGSSEYLSDWVGVKVLLENRNFARGFEPKVEVAGVESITSVSKKGKRVAELLQADASGSSAAAFLGQATTAAPSSSESMSTRSIPGQTELKNLLLATEREIVSDSDRVLQYLSTYQNKHVVRKIRGGGIRIEAIYDYGCSRLIGGALLNYCDFSNAFIIGYRAYVYISFEVRADKAQSVVEGLIQLGVITAIPELKYVGSEATVLKAVRRAEYQATAEASFQARSIARGIILSLNQNDLFRNKSRGYKDSHNNDWNSYESSATSDSYFNMDNMDQRGFDYDGSNNRGDFIFSGFPGFSDIDNTQCVRENGPNGGAFDNNGGNNGGYDHSARHSNGGPNAGGMGGGNNGGMAAFGNDNCNGFTLRLERISCVRFGDLAGFVSSLLPSLESFFNDGVSSTSMDMTSAPSIRAVPLDVQVTCTLVARLTAGQAFNNSNGGQSGPGAIGAHD